MKILVLGATGGTGQHVITQALARGYDVTALVRTPEKISVKDDKLTVVQGDIMSQDDVRSHLTGCDAVISTVGGRPGPSTPCDVYSRSVKVTTDVMKQVGVTRFIMVTAWGTKDDPDLPTLWRNVLKPGVMRNIVTDMEAAEDFLREHCSHVDFTVVRPPRLSDDPGHDGDLQVAEERMCVAGCTTNVVARQDLARFLLDCLGRGTYQGAMVAVNGPSQSI